MSLKGKRKSPPPQLAIIYLYLKPQIRGHHQGSAVLAVCSHVQQALQVCSVKESSSSKESWKDVHLCSLLSSNFTLMPSSFPLSLSPFSLIHTHTPLQTKCTQQIPLVVHLLLPPSLSLSVHLPLLLILSLHLKEQCTDLMFQLKGITFNKKTNSLNQEQ